LEFTGERQGAITFYGVEGRSYRGGNNPLERYINAHPADVSKLVDGGEWRIVSVAILPDVAEPVRAEPIARTPPAPLAPVAPVAEAVIDGVEVEVKTKLVDTGDGVIAKKRIKPKREKESALLDLPEQA
jgi:hypothetical protein